jgi:lysophospholipase L1-like esterase
VLLLGDFLVWQSQSSFTTELQRPRRRGSADRRPEAMLGLEQLGLGGRAAQAVATYRPDIIVLESAIFNELDRKYFDGLPDTDADVARWTALAEQLTDIAQSGGARVHWVLAPIPGPGAAYYGPVATRVPQANAIYRQISAARGLSVIDWGQVFSPDGQYHETVPDEQGNPVVVHVADQMHFNEAGQALMARFTARALFG